MDDPLLLTVDIGNSTTVVALYAGRDRVERWTLPTERGRSAPEMVQALRDRLGARAAGKDGPSAGIVASVVPEQDDTLRAACVELFGWDPWILDGSRDQLLPIRGPDPAGVGVDRLVNAVAAFARVGGPCLVVDAGTATTFDVVSGRGEFLGGAIAPGPSLLASALNRRTSKLPLVPVERPERVVGRDTRECLQVGLYWGYVALVEGLVGRMLADMEEGARVLATGGAATRLLGDVATIDELVPDLTLEGLRLIHERRTP